MQLVPNLLITNATVSTVKDNGCWIIGISDHEIDPTCYVILQASFEDEDQDIRLGTAGIHVEIEPQRLSGYGLVERLFASANDITIVLTPRGAEAVKSETLVIKARPDQGLLAEFHSFVKHLNESQTLASRKQERLNE